MARDGGSGTEAQQSMIEQLLQNAQDPPREVVGVSQEFLDGLERVSKKSLKKEEDCPICGQPFLDGTFIPASTIDVVEEGDAEELTLRYRPLSTRRPVAVPRRPQVRPGVHCAVAEDQYDVSAGPEVNL
jgi:hypothetical protein